MARQTRNLNPRKAIYVFWEGESEEAYSRFLRRKFADNAAIRVHQKKGTFLTAKALYRSNPRFQSDVSELDEIWFFFDTEVEKGGQWNDSMGSIKNIVLSRGKKNPIRIRLLMTSCCIEYWLLLHFERTAPAMASPSDKERVLKSVLEYEPSYKKGDYASTASIAENYAAAIENGRWVLESLNADGMPARYEDDTQLSDEWLFKGTHTFTTVHEAIEMLLTLPKLR